MKIPNKKDGKLLCGSSEAFEYIDSMIVQAIDADDIPVLSQCQDDGLILYIGTARSFL